MNNKFKAGDFTSGKMNEIFKVASEFFSDGAKINHKQLGDFSLVGDKMVETIYNEILRTNFGIFKSDDGMYKSCFNPTDKEGDICEAAYLLDHQKDDPEAMIISYEVLHCFGDSIRNYSFVDMITLLTYKQVRNDDQWGLSVDVGSNLSSGLILSEKPMNNSQYIKSLAGKFEECMTWSFSNSIEHCGGNALKLEHFKVVLISTISDILDGNMEEDAKSNFDLLLDYTLKSEKYFLGVNDGKVTFKTFSA